MNSLNRIPFENFRPVFSKKKSIEFWEMENPQKSSNSQKKSSFKAVSISETPLKIIVLGDISVGKTSLISRYIKSQFPEKHQATSGVCFNQKKVFMGKNNLFGSLDSTLSSFDSSDNTIYNLQIWDTAGQEKYRSVTTHFYKGSRAAIIVVDFSEPKSFDSLNNWIKTAQENNCEDMIVCVFANKSDLINIDAKQKNMLALKEICEMHNVNFFIGNAKFGDNIETMFKYIVNEVADSINESKKNIVSLKEFDNKYDKYYEMFDKNAGNREAVILKLNSDFEKKEKNNNCC